MKQQKHEKLKALLQQALDCLDQEYDAENGSAPEHESKKPESEVDDGSTLKMKLQKYRG